MRQPKIIQTDGIQVTFSQHIAHYENAFHDKHCKEFIEFFDYHKRLGITELRTDYDAGAGAQKKKDESMSYHQVPESTKFTQQFGGFIDYTINRLLPVYATEYFDELAPNVLTMYEGKVQLTQPSEGYHIWHCESYGNLAKNRVLAWSLFLNDVEDGGETEFLEQSLRFKPKAGDFLMWPAGFTHLHRGNPPLSGHKYIATGWIEYK